MMDAAQKLYPNLEPLFELSLHNADKGGLNNETIEKRVNQFTSRGLNLALTNAPLFI